jgi:hypothetical protein
MAGGLMEEGGGRKRKRKEGYEWTGHRNILNHVVEIREVPKQQRGAIEIYQSCGRGRRDICEVIAGSN